MNKEEIEELAFKDRKELANLNELDLLEIIEFLQNDRKQWINQFTQTHNESIDIQKENQELKEKLDKYENPEDMTLFAMWCTEKVKDENLKLKKQLEDTEEELELIRCDLHNRTSERDGYERELDECLSQQQEFIKYLEDMLDDENDMFSVVRVKDVLQKYKEIIGVEDENI